jgi:hypothetical protein
MIPIGSGRIWKWDKFHWKGYLLTFPQSLRTPQLKVVCNLSISSNVDSSCTSWTLDIELDLEILLGSDFSWPGDWCHWKVYLVLFPCICRTYNPDFVCIMYINLT